MVEMVEDNLTKVQSKQKCWYDKGARLGEFKVRDPILVLLTASSSKLLAQWQVSYQNVGRMGKVTIEWIYTANGRDREYFT